MSGTPPTIPKSQARRGRLNSIVAAFGWVLVGVYFAFAILVIGFRYFVLPDAGRYSADIEQAMSRAIGERVTIGGIRAHWQGLHPELELSEVSVHDKEGRVALSLPAVEAVIGWRSLAFFSLRLHSLIIDQPDLDIRRDAAGRFFVAGVQLRSQDADVGAGDWLLSQSEIVIRNARLAWTDERRGAPRLELSGVTFMLQNSGSMHRFALRAQTDPGLASALDVRGEFVGESLENIDGWRGLAYAELDYVNLAAWKPWFDYPMDLVSGKGALRLWMNSDGQRITEVNADLALADVRARLAADLPMLDLEYLQGHLGGSRSGASSPRQLFQAHGSQLTLKSVHGTALPPADFALRWEGPAPGSPERGELQANSLEFEPLANLAEFLPLPQEARAKLARVAPRGSVNELKLSWTGDMEQPSGYSLRGRFSKLDMNAPGGWGAFAGLSGELNASKAGGSLRIDAANAVIDLPAVLPEGRARFDKLAAQIGWDIKDDHVEVKFSNVNLANADGAGSLSGTYSTRSRYPDSPGVIDLTGRFARADAKAVYRYIPHLPKSVQDYLKDAIVSGQASDARLHLKGDLHEFPYRDGKSGTFQVSARVANAVFRYAEGWPQLSDINGELSFDARRMQIMATRAAVFGARVGNTRVQIPDLFGGDAHVLVDGQAEGPSAEFLRFIASSPVTGYIDGATRGIGATGAGRLQLKLDIPVRRLGQTKVAGSYQMLANQVDINGGVPQLTQVNGRLEFTESSVAARDIAAQFLGGPASFGLVARAQGGAVVEAQGSASMAALRKFVELPLLDGVGGTGTWRGTLRINQGNLDLNVESPLVGVSLALPEPFIKLPQEALPFRLEYSSRNDAEFLRRIKAPNLAPGGDAFAVSLGTRASGVVLRRVAPAGYQVDRGAIGIGEPLPAMDRAGISVTGKFAHLDVDRWRRLLDTGRGDSGAGNLVLSSDTLDISGRRLNEVRLRAAPTGTAWTATIASRELSGSLSWRPEGAGRVVARLKHFTVPDPPPGPLPPEIHSAELPALDIVADSFIHNDRNWGRLELVAVNEVRDWRIDKLSLVTEESQFTGNGVWQNWTQRPGVSMNVKLELSDAGGFLSRLGYPGTMKAGAAKLEGKVAWQGNPQSIDYPSLTGDVILTASNGQFLKAEPGIAKLLGILSMQTWITLDFRGLFGEGFAFDTITGSARINKGVLGTNDFAMSGKTAKVTMAGTINLAQETQNLKVRVVPSIGDGVSSIAALAVANPAIGLIALLVQRVLGDPVGKIFAFDYTVLGTWSDPKVERINAGPAALDAQLK
jgi:uncharacterized protein (TIGR02099 family)